MISLDDKEKEIALAAIRFLMGNVDAYNEILEEVYQDEDGNFYPDAPPTMNQEKVEELYKKLGGN